MLYKKIYCIAFYVSLFSAPVFADNDVTELTIVAPNYPPFYDESGHGLINDIVKESFSCNDIGVTTLIAPVGRSSQLFLQGAVDAMAAGNVFIPLGFYSRDIINVPVINMIFSLFYYDNNNEKVWKGDFMHNKSVGVIVNSPRIDEYEDHGISYTQIQTPKQLVSMAYKSNIDLFESSVLTALHYIEGYSLLDRNRFYLVNGKYIPLRKIPVAISFMNNARGVYLANKLKEGVKCLIDSGRYLKSIEAYWGQGGVPEAVLISSPDETTALPDFVKYWETRR